MSDQAETLRLQSGEWVRVRSYDPSTLGLVRMVSEDEDREQSCVDIRPDEARALAALLLKHADRAEGRGT